MGTLSFTVRSAYQNEWEDAMALAWRTFQKFEADVYSEEGVRNFVDFITDTTLHRMFMMGTYRMFVAHMGEKMVGMITLREKTHISLLFVDAEYHMQGIGRALIERVKEYLSTELGENYMTVNSSPYGVGFYHKLGFLDMRPEEEKDGIIYTPMRLVYG